MASNTPNTFALTKEEISIDGKELVAYRITANKVGRIIIKASVGSLFDEVDIEVISSRPIAIGDIILKDLLDNPINSDDITSGDVFRIEASTIPTNTVGIFEYISSDERILEITDSNKAKAMASGDVTIRVVLTNALTPQEKSITINIAKVTSTSGILIEGKQNHSADIPDVSNSLKLPIVILEPEELDLTKNLIIIPNNSNLLSQYLIEFSVVVAILSITLTHSTG